MPDAPVTLRIGGLEYSGWTSVRVRRSIETACGSFELVVSERFPENPAGRQIRRGSECSVAIGGERIIAGHVDSVDVQIEARLHQIAIRGRDRLADLVDSAPEVSPGEWLDIDLLGVARQLASPFGVSVRADAPVGARFEKVALAPGQTAWAVIEERARYRQVLPVSDGLGGLVFTRAGSARSPVSLVEGQNILSGRVSDDETERFSTYVVKGQSFLGAADDPTTPRAEARDPEISRHRPMVVVAGSSVDSAQAEQRAKWEAIVRAARGRRAEITVQGWRQPNGALWPLNALVYVDSPTLGIRGTLLIAELVYALDESSGSRTELSLLRPDAFTAQPGLALSPSESFA